MKTVEVSDYGYYTVQLATVYNDNSETYFQELETLIEDKYVAVKLVGYHEDVLKERKKAFGLKGGYGARKTPFAVLFDNEDNPIQAFYSEVNECTVDNIKKASDSFIVYNKQNENESSSN